MIAELHAAWPCSDAADRTPPAELQCTPPAVRRVACRRAGESGRWEPLRPVRATSNMPLLTIEADDSIFVSGDTTKRDEYVVTLWLRQAADQCRPPGGPAGRPASRHGPGMTYYEGRKGDFFLGELRLVADGKPVAIRGYAQLREEPVRRGSLGGPDDRRRSADRLVDLRAERGTSHGGLRRWKRR